MLILGLVDVPMWLILIPAIAVLLYLYGTRDHNYFKNIGINGPKPKPFIGNMGQLVKEGVYNFYTNVWKKYGKVAGVFHGSTKQLVIFDHELISEIMVKQFNKFANRRSFGAHDSIMGNMLICLEYDEWKRVRSVTSPTFTTGKLRKMSSEINRCARQLVDQLSATEGSFEMKEKAGAYAMDVIATTAFGLQTSNQTNKEDPFSIHSKAIANTFTADNKAFLALLVSETLSKILDKLGFPLMNRAATNFFTKITEQTLKARQEDREGRNDFIQLMANAQQGKQIHEQQDEAEIQKLTTSASKGLTTDEIVANAILFFFAGYDTSSLALSQLCYCLACNPEFQDKVVEEINRVVGDKEELDYDLMMKMTYLEQCIHETLRIYPAVPWVDRVCTEDTELGEIKVPKGVVVTFPLYPLNHDPETWPNPEKFDPDRFSAEEKAKRSFVSANTFGTGPRMCIGNRLALLTVKTAAVTVLRSYRFVTCDKTEQPLTLDPNKWMAMKNGVWLAVEKR